MSGDHDVDLEGEIRLLCGTSDGAGISLRIEKGSDWQDSYVVINTVECWISAEGEEEIEYDTQPTAYHAQTTDLDGVLDWLRSATVMVESAIRRRAASRDTHRA